MRSPTILLSSLLVLAGMHTPARADELSEAYTKEFTFLKAQKDELAKRLKKEQSQQNREIAAVRTEVRQLQDRQVALSRQLKEKESRLEKEERKLQERTSNKEIIDSVIIQAKMSLESHGINIDYAAESQLDTLSDAFDKATTLYRTLSSTRVRNGTFFLLDGTTTEGEIVAGGNIAAYGISAKASGALAPAGNGELKLWNRPGSDDDAQALYRKKPPRTLDIFIYENLDKDVEYQKEKSTEDVLKSGGFIGFVIVGFGVLGLLLLLVRVLFLFRASSKVKTITEVVQNKIESGEAGEAYEAIKDYKGSTARVIRATLRNINSEREKIEDIITESILNENRALDRFGGFILVIAAVAPLLGLLGTVTGMIHTFDIITIHGTGDPKLLSGGISEALVTTMLGLIVAIPILLLGNISNGWAENIKDSMEQSALHVVILFEKHTALNGEAVPENPE